MITEGAKSYVRATSKASQSYLLSVDQRLLNSHQNTRTPKNSSDFSHLMDILEMRLYI